MDFIYEIDFKIIKFINQKMRHKLFDYFNIAITYLGSDVFALGLILALVVLPYQYFRPFAINSAVSLLISTIIVQSLKRIVKRKRPFVQIKDIRSIKIGVDQYSFPSGHTTAAFCLATSASLLTANFALSFVFVLLAFLVGFSRVYLGVHYPSDVLTGAFIGSSLALIVHAIMTGY